MKKKKQLNLILTVKKESYKLAIVLLSHHFRIMVHVRTYPEDDHYVIGDFTTATSNGAIGYSVISSCVVFVVSCCVTDRSSDFVYSNQ